MPAAAATLSPEVLAQYQPVIGLEVHVQLLTATKNFCGCKNEYGGDPNTHTCPVCLGLPGALPVLNRDAVEKAVLAASAMAGWSRRRSLPTSDITMSKPTISQIMTSFMWSIAGWPTFVRG